MLVAPSAASVPLERGESRSVESTIDTLRAEAEADDEDDELLLLLAAEATAARGPGSTPTPLAVPSTEEAACK
jgi:hypothetical protein